MKAPEQAPDQEKPSITIIDHGDGPRTVLQYEYRQGESTEVTFRYKTAMGSKDANDPVSGMISDIPAVVLKMKFTVIEVSRTTGDVKLGFNIITALAESSDPDSRTIVTMMNHTLEQLIGTKGFVTMGRDGQSRVTHYELPPGTSDTLKEQVRGMTESIGAMMPWLPDLPMGKHGKWQINSKNTIANGANVSQSMTFMLSQINPNRFIAHVDSTQNAGRQDISSGGQTMTIESMSTKGSGESEVNLKHLRFHYRAHMESDTVMTVMGQQLPMHMSTDITFDTPDKSDLPPEPEKKTEKVPKTGHKNQP